MNTKSRIQNLVGRVTDQISNQRNVGGNKSRPLVIEALEPRVLFSGSPAPAPAPAPAEAPAAQEAPTPAPVEAAPATEVSAEDAAVAAPPEASVPTPEGAVNEEETSVALTETDLSEAELSALADAAAGIWAGSGISEDQSADLSSASYQIADLGGNIIGSADGNLITIDDDAAGHGWFIDDTPLDDSEFTSDATPTSIDLLSVLLHEQGHVLGLEDTNGFSDIMNGVFVEGERRLPADSRAEGAAAVSLEGIHYATSVGVDTTTGANWRTDALWDSDGDNQYGTDGYVIYGINQSDGVYTPTYTYNQDQEVLPTYITGIIPPTSPMWSGNNANFGQIEDPANGNALTNTPLLANGGDTFTIQRTSGAAFRLTVLVASGDNNNVTFTTAVDDGVNSQSQVGPAHTSNGLHYHVYDIEAGNDDVVVTITTSAMGYKATGFAFDTVIPSGMTATNAGLELDFTGWRTSADTALSGGDNEYGTDGYRLFGAAGAAGNGQRPSLTSDPSYATTSRDAALEVSYNYASIDNPTGAGTIVSGTTTDQKNGTNPDLITTITIGADAPGTFRLGLMSDNLDGTQFVSPSYEIRDGNNAQILTTVSAPTGNHNQSPDWYFVDVAGAVAGDVIEIWGAKSTGNFVTLGALTFDTVFDAIDDTYTSDEDTVLNLNNQSAYAGKVQSLGSDGSLIGFWDFNEGSGGTATDVSGNGNDGTITGASYTAAGAGSSGESGDHALDFGNGNDRVVVDISSGDFAATATNNAVTVSLWQFGDAAQPQNDTIFSGRTTERQFQSHLPWSNSNVYWDTGGPGYNRINQVASNDLFEGQWNHWTFVKDGSETAVYVNGEFFMGASGQNNAIEAITQFTIGADNSSGGNGYNGLIDDFAVFSKGLSAAEVAELYASKNILENDTAPRVNLALGGTASQVSTRDGGEPSPANTAGAAIDGDTNGNFGNNSVTHTASGTGEQWWKVELDEGVSEIDEIVIHNRTDCCGGRLSDFTVAVYDGDPDDGGTEQFSYFHSGTIGASLSIDVDGIDPAVRGDYVRVSQNNGQVLSLAEVQVFSDAPIIVDSETTSASGAAVAVNDDGSFTYDPTASATIQALGEGAMLTDTFTYTITDSQLPTIGRFVMVQNNGTEERRMDIGEIEVFAPGADLTSNDEGGNAATDFATAAVGASVHSKGAISGFSQPHGGDDDPNLIDGNAEGGGDTWSSNGVGNFVIIDLGQNRDIETIRVHQRQGCCQDRLSDFTVSVLADDGAGNPGAVVSSEVYTPQPPNSLFGEVTMPKLLGTNSDTATVSILVNGINDAPVGVGDDGAVTETANAISNPTTSGNVLTNDTDVDDPNFSLTVTTTGTFTGTYGSLLLNGDGTYTYTLDDSNANTQALTEGEEATDTFSYTVNDNHSGGNAKTGIGILTITVTGANDSPTATDNTAEVTEDTAISDSGNVITDDDGNGADSDVDTPLTVTDVDGTTIGSSTTVTGIYGDLIISDDGSYTYNLDNTAAQSLIENELVSETFTYTVNDNATSPAIGRFVQVVETSGSVDQRFHLSELEVFEVDVTPDDAGGTSFGGLSTSTNDIGGGVPFNVGGNVPEVGTSDDLGHGNPNNQTNNILESAGDVWSTDPTGPTPQFTLDLGQEYAIERIRAWPRADSCCTDRWDALTVNIYADDGTGNPGDLVSTINIPDPGGNIPHDIPVGLVDVSETVTATLTVSINGLNDAPVLAAGVGNFNDVGASQFENDGDLVSHLVNGQITDVDNGALIGAIAVTGTNTITGTGHFEYSIGTSGTWADIDSVSDGSALLLLSDDRIRFVPDGTNSGQDIGELTFRAWDQTGTTTGKEGTKVDASANGGTSPFSADARTSKVTVAELIKDGDEIVYAPTTGEVNTLGVTYDATTGELVFTDSTSAIGSGFDGGGTSTVRVALAAGDDLTIETNDEDDTVTIGSLGIFDGTLTIDGEDGQDQIIYQADGVTLAAGDSASFAAEEVDFVLGDLTTTDGDITVDGTGGTGNLQGVHLLGSSLAANGVGNTITLNGSGGDAGSSNHGVLLSNGSSVTTADGNIDIDGQGGSSGVAGKGVMIYSGSSLSAGGGGTLTIDGTAGGGTFQNEGVLLGTGTSASVADGDMAITGTGSGDSGLGLGVSMSGAQLTSTGGGNITIAGTSTATGGINNSGVQLWSTDIDGSAGSGNVTISGSGAAAGTSNNMGVRLSNVDITTATDASIDIDGTGAGTATGNIGVQMSADVNLTVTGAGGNLTIDGTGGSGTSNNDGVDLGGSTSIIFDDGSVTIAGTGAGSLGQSQGVTGSGASITGSGAGSLTITGSSTGEGSANQGILLSSSSISNTGGSITMTGTGSAGGTGVLNTGISLSGTSVSGSSVTIGATGGAGTTLNEGFRMIGGSLATGDLSLTGMGGAGSGIYNSGLYIVNADLSGAAGSVTGTGGGGSNYNHGISMINTGFGGSYSATAGSGPLSEAVKFFSVLPFALIAAADSNTRRRTERSDTSQSKKTVRELLDRILKNSSLLEVKENETLILRSFAGHIAYDPIFSSTEEIESAADSAGIEIASAPAGSRRVILLTGDDHERLSGVVALVGKDGEIDSLEPLDLMSEITVIEFIEAIDLGSKSRIEWSNTAEARADTGSLATVNRRISDLLEIG